MGFLFYRNRLPKSKRPTPRATPRTPLKTPLAVRPMILAVPLTAPKATRPTARAAKNPTRPTNLAVFRTGAKHPGPLTPMGQTGRTRREKPAGPNGAWRPAKAASGRAIVILKIINNSKRNILNLSWPSNLVTNKTRQLMCQSFPFLFGLVW